MFTISEAELLDSRMSHTRFTELVNQHATEVHEIQLANNLYGEFMFITLSAHIPQLSWAETNKVERRWVTFWGMGYHESRERWECDSWRWDEVFGRRVSTQWLSKSHIWSEVNERRAFCLTEAQSAEPPSKHAQAFAFFAEMGDEDGATTMLEEMDYLGVDVDGLFDE